MSVAYTHARGHDHIHVPTDDLLCGRVAKTSVGSAIFRREINQYREKNGGKKKERARGPRERAPAESENGGTAAGVGGGSDGPRGGGGREEGEEIASPAADVAAGAIVGLRHRFARNVFALFPRKNSKGKERGCKKMGKNGDRKAARGVRKGREKR